MTGKHPIRPVASHELVSESYDPGDYEVVELNASGTDAPRKMEVWRVWQYRWSILLVFLVVAAVGVVGVFAVSAPIFEATAKVEVSPVIPQLVEGNSDMVPLYESYRSSQVDHITGAEVIDAVLDRERVRATHWYRGTPHTPLDRLLDRLKLRSLAPPRDRLAAALEAKAPSRKQHIYVSMQSHTPGEAKLLVDAVVEEFVRFSNQRASDSELDRMSKLRSEIMSREGELTRLETVAAEYRQRLRTGRPAEVLTQRLLRLDELTSELRALEREIEVAGALVPNADSATTQPATAAEDDGLSLENDDEWKRLQSDLAEARRQVETAPDHISDLHPTMTRLRRSVEYAQQRLREREEELRASDAPAIADPARTRIRELRASARILREAVAEEEQAYNQTFRDAEALLEIDTKVESLRKKLELLRRELERIEMNRQVAGTIHAWRAYEPTTPVRDRRTKLALAAVVGACAFAVGVALVRVKMSPMVADADEAITPIGGAFLGRLPLRSGKQSTELAPAMTEPVRMVRTALLHTLEATGGKIVQFTSASPGSGKSTLTALLGRSLAQLGKRVLVIDADVRKPSLAREFGLEGSVGLVDLLTQRQPELPESSATEVPSLCVLPAGDAACEADFDRLANGDFSALLRRWREAFDIILLDSPPLSGAADAAILSRQVDGTVVVVREKHCRRASLVRAVSDLRSAGGRLLGTVFVGSDRSANYGYGYGYAYGYGNGREGRMNETDAREPAR